MSEPFLGQIQAFAFNFAPAGWAQCNGQVLPITQNTALFSLLGTTYGGDARTTFGLPDLRGRASLHTGAGPGLSARSIGQSGGTETVLLDESALPTHNHALTLRGSTSGLTGGADDTPTDKVLAKGNQYSTGAANTDMASDAIDFVDVGGGQAHENMSPYLVINWCISLTGDYPPRS